MVVFAMCMVMGKEDLGMRKFLFAKFGCEEGWPPSRCKSHLRGHLGESPVSYTHLTLPTNHDV